MVNPFDYEEQESDEECPSLDCFLSGPVQGPLAWRGNFRPYMSVEEHDSIECKNKTDYEKAVKALCALWKTASPDTYVIAIKKLKALAEWSDRYEI